MSCNSRSLLFLLQRCVAVRQVTLPRGINTSCSVLSGRCEFIQQRTWTSTPRAVCQLQSAVRTSQYRFCTKAGEPCEDEYPPLPPYQPDPEPVKEVYIMHVKGIPWSCSAQDVLQFFSECRICDGTKGIHLIMDRQGRPSGEAFIEVEHKDDVRKALEKHRQYLGPRYLEVFEVTNSDAEAILKRAVQNKDILNKDVSVPAEHGVVRVQGLPFSCTEADIAQFFSGLDIVENGITFVLDHKGRNSGTAFIQFSSQEAADEALQKDRENMGHRYIEVFPSRGDKIYTVWKRRMRSASPQMADPQTSDPQMADPQTSDPQMFDPQTADPQTADPQTADPQTADPQTPDAQSEIGGTVSPKPTRTVLPHSSARPLHYIHMRGLPFHVSGEDIIKFFAPLRVSKIVLECGPRGRLNGEGDIYFSRHQDALTAMSRDGQHIGERYIELFLNSEEDFNRR